MHSTEVLFVDCQALHTHCNTQSYMVLMLPPIKSAQERGVVFEVHINDCTLCRLGSRCSIYALVRAQLRSVAIDGMTKLVLDWGHRLSLLRGLSGLQLLALWQERPQLQLSAFPIQG